MSGIDDGRRVTSSRLPGEGYIKGFDGLRAIAVLMVMVAHLGWWVGPLDVVRQYSVGVAIFFVLSGFLITAVLLGDEHRSIPRFVARRLLRLCPALLIYLVGVLIAGWLGWDVIPGIALVAGALFFTNYLPGHLLTRETSHLWSIGVQEQFYLLWPFVVFHFRRAAVPPAVVAVAVACYLRAWPIHGGANPYVVRYFIPAADAILIGSLAALLVCPRFRTNALIRRVASAPLLLVVALVAYSARGWLELPWASSAAAQVLLEAQYVGIALLVVWICANQDAVLVRALELRPLRYLGRISFGVYLWQGMFVRNGPGDPSGWFHEFPYNVALSIGVAALSYELVERQVHRRTKPWFRPALTAAETSVAPQLAASVSPRD